MSQKAHNIIVLSVATLGSGILQDFFPPARSKLEGANPTQVYYLSKISGLSSYPIKASRELVSFSTQLLCSCNSLSSKDTHIKEISLK